MSDTTLRKAIDERRARNKSRSAPAQQAAPQVAPQVAPQATPQHDLAIDPITTPGWFKRRPKHLKGFIDRGHTPLIKSAIARARAHRMKKAIHKAGPKPYLDEIVVLGERVILDESGVHASTLREPQVNVESVFFSPAYFAGEKDINKITQAKTAFSKVFAPGTTFGVNNPVPPCEVSEYNLLKEGLENRLYLLRMNLPSNIDDTISMDVRNLYHQAEVINSIIQAIEANDSLCTNYELKLKNGLSSELKSFATPISRADSQRMQNLLRQFSFLVLQSMNPISGYENTTGIDPHALIQSLEQNQISKDDMDEYIAEYNESSHEIPDVISQALEATGAQENVYNLMLEGELANLISYVNRHVLENLSDPILKTKFTNYTKTIEGNAVKDQIVSILKWILDEYTGHKKLISDNLSTLHLNKTETDKLRMTLSEKEEKIQQLESSLLKTSNDLKNAEQGVESQLNMAEENKSLTDKFTKSHQELREELALRTGERETLKAQLEKLIKESNTALVANSGVNKTLGALQGALNVAANPKFVGFLSKVRTIADSVSNNKEPPSEGDPFKQLYNEFNAHPEYKSSNVCYLNYYVIFFIKSLFTNDPDLYDILNEIVTANLSKHKEVDNIVEDFSSLLTKSETGTKNGYYITNIKATSQLKDLYNAIKGAPKLNNRCLATIKKTFPGYSPKPIFYVTPLEDSSFEQAGFIIKSELPSDTMPMFKWNETAFEVLEGVAPVKILDKTSLSYSTFFMLYILFAKEYLIKKQDTRCPIPSFVKDPGQLRMSFKTPIEVKVVVPKNPVP